MSSLQTNQFEQSTQVRGERPTIGVEVDLREFFTALWKGKWIISFSILLFLFASVAYVLNAQEWWSSKATVSQPRLQDIAEYQKVVKRYQPLFDVYQEDGTVIVSKTLDKLIEPEAIFQRFILEFNANVTKRRFMQSNSEFIKIQREQLKTDDAESLQRFYEEWFSKIVASPEDKSENSSFLLTFQSINKASSLTLLKYYIVFVNNIVNEQLFNDLDNTLNVKYGELNQQEKNLYEQAQLRLKVELQRTMYALNIAKKAGVDLPVQNLGEQELFAINIGSKALKAKVDALKSIDDMSVFEPRLSILKSQLSQFDLNLNKNNRSWNVNSFYYLEEPEKPLSRDQPRRLLIIALMTIFGGVLGFVIIMIRFLLSLNKINGN
ncbi:LPS chain length-determining protein [Vibrio fluvialis]|nr:LPS chain length-determining protein [Vibrio fluvialis]